MIVVNCPIKHDFIKEVLSSIEKYEYKFESEKGLQCLFSVNTEDIADAIKVAKSAIKETEIGSVLFFSIKEAE